MKAYGLQSAHKCMMTWQPCDATLDSIIGPCLAHGSGRSKGVVAANQVCGAFIVSDPLTVEPIAGFDFAFDDEQAHVRIEVHVSKKRTVIYEGGAEVVEHRVTGTSSDKILCDRGLCLRSSSLVR